MQNKRGQFYLIATMIILAMVIGLVTVKNTSKKQEFGEIEEAAEELSIEIEAVLDYVVFRGEDVNTQMRIFMDDYLKYSNIENIYFFYGEKADPNVYIKTKREKSSARITVEGYGVDVEIGENPETFRLITDDLEVVINDILYKFKWLEGNNFYFILSEGNERDEEYLFSGNVVKRLENEA